jgi:hypothetical protein
MSSGNCTSKHSDHKHWHCKWHEFYDLEMWWSHSDSRVFGLYDIKVVFITIFNVSSLKIHRVLLIYSIFLTQATKNWHKLSNYQEGRGQLPVACCAQVQNPSWAVKFRAWALSLIGAYQSPKLTFSTYIWVQVERLTNPVVVIREYGCIYTGSSNLIL